MMTALNTAIAEAIAIATDTRVQPGVTHAIAGGDINTCLRYDSAHTPYFVKCNSHPHARSMFATEAQVLTAMAHNNCIRIPKPVATGACSAMQFLVLEYLPLGGPARWRTLGQQLAGLHRDEHPRFGWHCDNFIGTSNQQNNWSDTWAEFFWQSRLSPQMRMAIDGGHSDVARFESGMRDACMRLLARHQPVASLVHGDLWAGNAGFTASGDPVIYDPAGYYADREVDLAMTELFGGFPPEFYQGYDSVWPLPGGYRERVALYNLYHLLNHLNLFGGGYLHQCLRTMSSLISG